MNKPDPIYRPWLHVFAVLLVIATFALIAIGGTVTSRGAGMDVEDWPTTFGYNMFTVPLDQWVNPDKALTDQSGVFWEHSHRLKGSVVGMMMIAMCVLLAVYERRSRKWLFKLSLFMLALVCVQGLMGGFRVTEESLFFAFVHGVNGQLFFGLTILVACALSKTWIGYVTATRTNADAKRAYSALCGFSLFVIALIVIQLVLGAAIRHSGSALAIPDFPTSYGSVIPPITQQSLDAAIDRMPQAWRPDRDYTLEQVFIHFLHRVGAVVASVAIIALFIVALIRHPGHPKLMAPLFSLTMLMVIQIMLGILVVIGKRYPEIATAHQSTGAALLGVSVWLAIRLHLVSRYDAELEATEPLVPQESANTPRSLEGQTA